MTKISFVLPVFNEEVHLALCIRSLLKQGPEHEIILIDDASTDHSPEIIQYFFDRSPERFILLRNETRKGGAYCRNKGNAVATGDFISVCDVDIYEPNKAPQIIEFFTENPKASLFYSAAICRDSKSLDEWQHPFISWDFKSKCPISHPTVAYTAKMAKKYKYPELSKETDLYEFFLLDMFKKERNFLYGGTETPTMIKLEKQRRRNKNKSNQLKKDLYKKYKIKVEEKDFIKE